MAYLQVWCYSIIILSLLYFKTLTVIVAKAIYCLVNRYNNLVVCEDALKRCTQIISLKDGKVIKEIPGYAVSAVDDDDDDNSYEDCNNGVTRMYARVHGNDITEINKSGVAKTIMKTFRTGSSAFKFANHCKGNVIVMSDRTDQKIRFYNKNNYLLTKYVNLDCRVEALAVDYSSGDFIVAAFEPQRNYAVNWSLFRYNSEGVLKFKITDTENISNFAVDDYGTVIAVCGKVIKVFDKNGNFVKDIHQDKVLSSADIGKNGYIVASTLDNEIIVFR